MRTWILLVLVGCTGNAGEVDLQREAGTDVVVEVTDRAEASQEGAVLDAAREVARDAPVEVLDAAIEVTFDVTEELRVEAAVDAADVASEEAAVDVATDVETPVDAAQDAAMEAEASVQVACTEVKATRSGTVPKGTSSVMISLSCGVGYRVKTVDTCVSSTGLSGCSPYCQIVWGVGTANVYCNGPAGWVWTVGFTCYTLYAGDLKCP